MSSLTVTRALKAAAIVAALVTVIDQLRRRCSRALLRKLLGMKEELWPLDEWVNLHREDAIDPGRPIVDAHHHLWDARVQPKGWGIPMWLLQLLFFSFSPKTIANYIKDDKIKNKEEQLLNSFGWRQLPFIQPYMGPDYLLDIRNRGCGKRGHNVVSSVYVECGWSDPNLPEYLQAIGEVKMVLDVQRSFPMLCQGIVAGVNLSHPQIEDTLKALKESPSVKGIRHALAWSSDPSILGAADHLTKDGKAAFDPDFRRGFALLQTYGLSYDVWMFHEQLAGLTDLARSFPDTIIILDHVAEPLGIGSYRKEETFPIWEKGIRELAAASENVHCKLSGLAMCRTGLGFDLRDKPPTSQELAAAWGPYFKVCLEAFGTKRCLFASNFPVDKVSCDYTVMWNAFKIIVKDYSEQDKQLLFHDNAKSLYSL